MLAAGRHDHAIQPCLARFAVAAPACGFRRHSFNDVRYIFLLVESAQDMLLSRRSRIVGRLSGHENRKVLVSTAGVLLGKSIQMSDDVYHAMISRGFRGDVHLMDDFHMQPRDWVALAAVVAVSGAAFMAGR